jgi:hypothetical protein
MVAMKYSILKSSISLRGGPEWVGTIFPIAEKSPRWERVPPPSPIVCLGPPASFAIDRIYQNSRMYVRSLQSRMRRRGTAVHAHVARGPLINTIVELAMGKKQDSIE